MQATARAQPNIALIKYWGKRDTARNLPAVGSISITLDSLATEMQVRFDRSLQADSLSINGDERADMLPRVSRCLDSLDEARSGAVLTSYSNFPLAAGLASSASAFAATVVAGAAALTQKRSQHELAGLAGLASGSAARSLYGGFAELENRGDEVAVRTILEAADWPLFVVIAITEPGPKPVSSGEAMEISRRSSPFYTRWVDDQSQDLDAARSAILDRDFAALARVAEHNCLKMHSVMWASRPPLVYWNAATLACLETVRSLQDAGHGVFFTIDGGPQVKAVCLPADRDAVTAALTATPGVREVMVSGLGDGARVIDGTTE